MKRFIFILVFIHTLCVSKTHGQNFFPLLPGFNNPVRSLYFDNNTNQLYAGGNFSKLANGTSMKGISRWNGISWDSLGYEFYGVVLTITKYNGLIYAGGSCSIIDSTGNYFASYFGSWDGTSWIIPQGGGANSAIWELYANGNDLYIGGAYDTINGIPADGIVRFDGVSWHTYPSLNSTFHYVNTITMYNNELYIGGNFNSGSGKEDILKFDGTNWVSVGGGFSGAGTVIDDMIVFQGELYVVGLFYTSWGDPGNGIAKWNGTNWSPVGSGVGNGQIFSIAEFKNEIYVGGNFASVGGTPAAYVAKWNGNIWQNLGSIFDYHVTCFASTPNDLYIGGSFYTVNSDPMNFITRYSPPLGIEENSSTTNFSIYPNSFTDKLNITINSNEPSEIIFYDITSRKTLQQSFTNSTSINTEQLSKGIYLYEVKNKNGVIKKGKVVKD